MPHEFLPQMKQSVLSKVLKKAQSSWNPVNRHLRDSIWQYSFPKIQSFLHGCLARGMKRIWLWAPFIRTVSQSSSSICIGRCIAKCLFFDIRFWIILAPRPTAWCPEFSYGIRCVLHWGFSRNVHDVKQKDALILFAFFVTSLNFFYTHCYLSF